jgi:transglutaminase-like putative cysteine protease
VSTATPTTATPSSTHAPAGIRWPSPRTWFDLAVLTVLAAVGVIGFEPSFGGYGFLLAGIGGLIVGTATGVLTAAFRLGPILSAAAALVAYFLLGTAFAVPHLGLAGVLPTLNSLGSIAVGSVFGWADLVTLSTPVGAPQYIAVVPYAAAWIVTLTSSTLACRWLVARPRTAWRFGIALVPPVVLYIASVLLGTDEPYQAGIRGVVFGLLALVWLGWGRPNERIAQVGGDRLQRRKLAGTAAVLVGAVVIGGGAAVVTAPASDQRFVLRDEIEPLFDPLDYPSPLAGFRHYTKQVTDDVLFVVDGLQAGDRIRLATMDAYTGRLWNVTDPATSAAGSGSFELVGRSFPEPELITADERAGVTFQIVDYADVWVPGVGYPSDLEFTAGDAIDATDDIRYNPATGTTVLTSGLATGDEYTIDALVQRPIPVADLAEVQTAEVDLSPVDGVPDIVTIRAQEFTGTASAPIDQLEAMRIALVENGFLSHGRASDAVPSRAGHGADRITELFERQQMVGDQEQYATAFALMARSLGYPARVVMGFAPEIADGQSAEVTGDDVTAWVEVAFDGIGWVAFDPTPEQTDVPQDQVPKPQSEPQPQVRQPPRIDDDREDLLSPVELEETEDDEEETPFRVPGWVWVVGLSILIPALLALLPLLAIALLKSARARRRRSTGPGYDRVAGAWEELEDRYSELGFAVPPKLTRGATATALETQLHEQLGEAAPRLRPLAAATDEAVFSDRDVDETRSEQVWTEALGAVATTRAALGGARRLVSRYRLRRVRDWVTRASRSRPGGER